MCQGNTCEDKTFLLVKYGWHNFTFASNNAGRNLGLIFIQDLSFNYYYFVFTCGKDSFFSIEEKETKPTCSSGGKGEPVNNSNFSAA